MGDVMAYLDELSLGHLGQQFRDNGVDGAFLAVLSEKDLVDDLGLTKLQARKVRSRWAAVA